MLISHPESEPSNTLESEAFSHNPEGRERIFSVPDDFSFFS